MLYKKGKGKRLRQYNSNNKLIHGQYTSRYNLIFDYRPLQKKKKKRRRKKVYYSSRVDDQWFLPPGYKGCNVANQVFLQE